MNDDLRYALYVAEQGGYSPGHCGECDAGTRPMTDDPDEWKPAHEPGCRIGQLLGRPVLDLTA